MKDGLKLRIKSQSGESFTVYENLIRRDYLTDVTLKPGDTVVDIGANIGSFSIVARLGRGGEGEGHPPSNLCPRPSSGCARTWL